MVRHILEVIGCERPVPLRLAAALEWLKHTRFKCLLVTTLLCLALRENYPFSNFPMYDQFTNRASYIFLTDAQGHPIATPRFALSGATLQKIFDRQRRMNLKKFKSAGSARFFLAENAAAESLLHYLDGLAARRPEAKKLLPGVQVQHVWVYQKSNALLLDTRTLARHQ
jgi:hypothetical protein